jgi:hypothetical protein
VEVRVRQSNLFSSGVIGVAMVGLALSACADSSNVALHAAPSPSTTASATVTTFTTGSVSVSAKSVNGTVVTVQLPEASARVAVTGTLESTAPSGYAASGALHGGLFGERNALAGTPDALLYIVLSSAAPVTLDGPSSVTVKLPSVAAGNAYFLAGLSASGTATFTEGPATIAGASLSFGDLLADPVVEITPDAPLVIELYATPATAGRRADSETPAA